MMAGFLKQKMMKKHDVTWPSNLDVSWGKKITMVEQIQEMPFSPKKK